MSALESNKSLCGVYRPVGDAGRLRADDLGEQERNFYL